MQIIKGRVIFKISEFSKWQNFKMSELRRVHVETTAEFKLAGPDKSSMDSRVRSLQASMVFSKFHVRVRDLRAEKDPLKRYLNVEL